MIKHFYHCFYVFNSTLLQVFLFGIIIIPLLISQQHSNAEHSHFWLSQTVWFMMMSFNTKLNEAANFTACLTVYDVSKTWLNEIPTLTSGADAVTLAKYSEA